MGRLESVAGVIGITEETSVEIKSLQVTKYVNKTYYNKTKQGEKMKKVILTIAIMMVMITDTSSAESKFFGRDIVDEVSTGGVVGYLIEMALVGSAATGPVGIIVGAVGGAVVYAVARERDDRWESKCQNKAINK